MAGGFFALLDDVASILDDVAAMTKVATKKTAGVLGDDLALNANQLTGIRASRELPIIWAVSKGSLLNKAIIVPIAFLLSAFLPAVVPLILMIGGAYLCYEGVEKILHRLLHQHEEAAPTQADDAQTPEQQEQDKIRTHRRRLWRRRHHRENRRPRLVLEQNRQPHSAGGGANPALVCAQTAQSPVRGWDGGHVYRRWPPLGRKHRATAPPRRTLDV